MSTAQHVEIQRHRVASDSISLLTETVGSFSLEGGSFAIQSGDDAVMPFGRMVPSARYGRMISCSEDPHEWVSNLPRLSGSYETFVLRPLATPA